MLHKTNKTLFKKYLLVNMSIVLTSFLLLGIMLWTAVSTYWQKEKSDLLIKNAKNIAELFQYSNFEIDSSDMQTFINIYSSNINADIFISDQSGTIHLISSETNISKKKSIPKEILNKTLSGEYIETGTLGNIYKDQHYIVGIPIIISEDNNDVYLGSVFTVSNLNNLKDFQMDLLNTFLIASILTLIISFIGSSIFSYKMVKPLSEMSEAAEEFGKGDFSKRVSISSNDEIGRLADSFNNMAESLSISENIRRNFVANVSHELKTPMTTISGFIDGILDGTIKHEKQNHYLSIVSSEVKRLSRLVHSMLDLSKIDSGELTLNKKSFDITKVILEALISFEDKIVKKNIDIQNLDQLNNIYIKGDIDMIHQVVYNLIENAVKFVNDNGYIQINMIEDNDKINISIKNSGLGIDKEDIPMIFDRFYKTDKSRSNDKTGVGLGLYIVKTIIRLHSGDIKVLSEKDQYTQFEFYLPKNWVHKLLKSL